MRHPAWSRAILQVRPRDRLAHRTLFYEYNVVSLTKYGFEVISVERRSPLRLPFKRFLDLFLWNVYRTIEFRFRKASDSISNHRSP